ncbi:MAG: hypothetical protein MJ016_04285 [Victivallaceae bacterium]|nr:hypothetical protein [Victivallaceae bacterium]
MFRVFADGDIVITRPIAFDEVRRGDIVVFARNDGKVIHRVWRKTASFLEMIGDNNPRPDAEKLGRNAALELAVVRIDRKKRRSPVGRGGRGVCRFVCNRMRRAVRGALSKMLHALLRVVDWRRKLPEPERFGDDLCYFSGERLIARGRADRPGVCFVRLSDRLKYRSR